MGLKIALTCLAYTTACCLLIFSQDDYETKRKETGSILWFLDNTAGISFFIGIPVGVIMWIWGV